MFRSQLVKKRVQKKCDKPRPAQTNTYRCTQHYLASSVHGGIEANSFIEGKKLTFVVTVCHTFSIRIQPYFYAVCRRPSDENVKRDWGCVCGGTENLV